MPEVKISIESKAPITKYTYCNIYVRNVKASEPTEISFTLLGIDFLAIVQCYNSPPPLPAPPKTKHIAFEQSKLRASGMSSESIYKGYKICWNAEIFTAIRH